MILITSESGKFVIIINSDGHGLVGHDVSGFLKKNLPCNFFNLTVDALENEIKKHSKTKEINVCIKDTFLDMSNKIIYNKKIDSQFRYQKKIIF